MAELDDLPALAREAIEYLTAKCDFGLAKDCMATLRAELLRLSSRVKELERENGELRADKAQLDKACRQHLTRALENGQAAQRAESELATFQQQISAAIGTTAFMDPPDGGDVSLPEQVRRMSGALAALDHRIAEAPLVLCEVPSDADPDGDDVGTFYMPPHLWNKTLALLDMGKEG